MKFNKAKSEVMHVGHGNPKYVHRLGEEPYEGSPVEKDFRVLVDKKLDMSQQCAPAAQKANCVPELHQKRSGQKGERADCPPLLLSSEAYSGVLCLGLGLPAQDRHEAVGASSEEGNEDDQGAGASPLHRKAEAARLI